MVVIADQRLRLEAMNELVGLVELPVRVRFVPPPIEPDAGNFAVVREQFTQLCILIVEILRPIAAFRPARGVAGGPAREVIAMVPIELRVVEEELDSLLVAFIGEELEDVALIGRPLHDRPVGNLGIKHGEAVVMLARDGDVLHAGGFR